MVATGGVLYFFFTNQNLKNEIRELKTSKKAAISRLDKLLSKLAEEASEVAKEALKAQQFGLNNATHEFTSNRQRLISELDDFNAIVKMLNDEFGLKYEPDHSAINLKIERVNSYIEIQDKIRGN